MPIRIFLFLSVFFTFQLSSARAAVIELQSGKTIEAQILDSSEKSLKVDYNGKTLYYKWHYIKSIDGKQPLTSSLLNEAAGDPALAAGSGLSALESRDIATGYFTEGIAYAAHGEFQKAEILFKKILSEDPTAHNAEEALHILTDFYQGKITPEHAINLFKGAQHLMKEEYHQAIVVYKEILMSSPDAWEVYYNIGNAYNNLEEYSEAIPFFEKIIERNPDDTDVWFHLGYAYYSLGHYLKAIPYFEKITDMFSDNAEAYTLLGISYQLVGQYPQAKTNLQKAKGIFFDRKDYAKAQELDTLLKKYRLNEIKGTIQDLLREKSSSQ
ncbi:MAG: tetratricopeptide repeat protein [Candidatus Omnitrophica bacterium]|nr:tetratricopeptide repeat protein [Candidatus Omnitrophota bacterium]